MVQVADSFWSAAAEGDSMRMSEVVSGKDPLVWSANMALASPTLFHETRGQLTAEYGYYYPTMDSDTAIVQVRVPFQSCRPPYHFQGLDRYFFMIVPAANQYRIVRVWSEPC